MTREKASILEAFRPPQIQQTLSGRVPEKHAKMDARKVGPGLEKGCPPGGGLFEPLGGLFGGLLLGGPPGLSGGGFWMVLVPFWKELGTFLSGCL